MFDLPLLLAWSGSDPAAGCANRSCQSTDEGCADPHRVFLERGPSVAPQHEICTSEKPGAKVIRKYRIACGRTRPPLTKGWARQASKSLFSMISKGAFSV